MRGPVVYCAEGVDNGELYNVYIDRKSEFNVTADCEFILPKIETKGFRIKECDELYYAGDEEYDEMTLTLIPYYAFANRSESEMRVWHPVK